VPTQGGYWSPSPEALAAGAGAVAGVAQHSRRMEEAAKYQAKVQEATARGLTRWDLGWPKQPGWMR